MRRVRQGREIGFSALALGVDSAWVIWLRTAKLAVGGSAALMEASRMSAEKIAAGLEAQAAAGMALATGRGLRAAARAVAGPYRKRVRANRKRLLRG
jgi:hypothetical protein